MKTRSYIVPAVVLAAFTIGIVVAYAHGPGGGSWGGHMMGGGGYGMMGGRGMMGGYGGGMTDDGQGIPGFRGELAKKMDESNQRTFKETETLRKQIREKRQELASLYRSSNPDRELVNSKIDELNKLESDFDKKMADFSIEKGRIPIPE